jgi:TRAP-type C4-dicarboxylate transport system permease small subunit
MRSLSDFLDRVYRLGGLLSGVGLVCLCMLVLYSILARLIGLYAGGATDFAGYVMATSTFLALADTFRANGHIRVQLLVQRFMGGTRRVIEIICLGIMAAATSFVAIYMIRLAYDSYDFGERSEGADAVLLWMPQTPVAIGALLLAVSVLHTFIQAFVDYDAVNPEMQGHEGPNEV